SEGKPLAITNSGNAPVDVVIDSGSFVADPVSAQVAAGDTVEAIVSFRPTDFGDFEGPVEIGVEGTLCQPLPQPPTASGIGRGAASAIVVGGPSRSRRNDDWQGGCAILDGAGGRVACWGSNNYWQLGTTAETRGP